MRVDPKFKPIALLMAGMIALFAAPWPAGAQDAVKIGFIYPETGPYSVEGLDLLRGAELARDEINQAGGVLGRRIELLARDSGSDRERGREHAAKLIQNDAVTMVFGEVSSDVSIAIGEVAHRHNVLFFAAMGASMDITGRDGYITTFRECADAWTTARLLGSYLLSNHHSQKYFYVLADYNWGWTTETLVRTVSDTLDVDGHKRAKIGLKAQDADIRAALAEAKAAAPDVLVLILFGEQFVTAIRIADELKLNRSNKVQIVVPSLTTTMAEKAGPSLMEGVIGATFWDWKVPRLIRSRNGEAFVDRFVEKHKRYPATPAASAYTILRQYKAAVERAQSFETDKVIKALEGWKYQSLKDEQEWRRFDHQSIQSVYLIKGRPSGSVAVDRDHFEIRHSANGHELALPQLKWIGERLYNGKSPKLD